MIMLLVDGVKEKLDIVDERLRVDQQCNNIKQEWYENDQILYNMMEDASSNNFVELLVIVITTLQCHPRFPKTAEFRILLHDIEDMLLKLAIKVEQMFNDLS